MKVKEICDYSGSTLLGMNGGMVESPDSKRIIYARKADLTKPETEIWICDRNFENHRKVYDVHCGNHNGPSATFITNSLIVFRDVEFEGIAGKEPSICVFRILNVDTGEVKYKIRGKESHCAENCKYPFSISTEYLDKNPDYPEINSCGIYILDVESGKITLVATEEDMPEWGSEDERGIDMEVMTAAADLAAGSDAVILRHPQSVKTIAKMIDALV